MSKLDTTHVEMVPAIDRLSPDSEGKAYASEHIPFSAAEEKKLMRKGEHLFVNLRPPLMI